MGAAKMLLAIKALTNGSKILFMAAPRFTAIGSIEKTRNVSAGRKHDPPPGGRIRWGEQSGRLWVQRRRNGQAGAEHFLSVGEIDRTITDSDNAQSNADR